MKTTLDLPEELVREMKIRAAREGRKLRDVATEVIQRGMTELGTEPQKKGHRVKLPLIRSTRVVPAEEQLTPEKIDEILLNQEIEWLSEINGTAK